MTVSCIDQNRKEKNGRNRNYGSNNRGSCNTDILHMSEFKWCHGPKCHTYQTQDRVRGTKGSKVLRTKKVKTTEWNRTNGYQYFCSTGCWNDFFIKYAQQCVAIAPRNEPLETPIDIETETRQDWNGHDYTIKNIKERVDTSMEQDYKGYRKDIYI